MRFLIFLSLISISYGHVWATLNVPGDSDTGTHAYQTATSTPNSTINFVSASAQTLVIGAINSSLTITQSSKSFAVTTVDTAGRIIQTTSSLNNPLILLNLKLINNSTSSTVDLNGLPTGAGAVSIENCYIENDGAFSAVQNEAVLPNANELSIQRSFLYAPSAGSLNGALRNSGILTVAGTIVCRNSILTGKNSGAGYINTAAISVNKTSIIDHCGFYDCNFGISTEGGEAVTNCLFLGNTQDFKSTGAGGVTTDLVTCGFGQLASGATSSFYGMTKARSFCNQGNYWIGPQDNNLNNGTTSLDGTVSYDGIIWGGVHPFGPNAFSLSLCGGYGVGH